jgi:hypothetical protein
MFKEDFGNLMEKHLYVGDFYFVNDNANAQIMCCIFCDKNLVIVMNLRTQVRNSLIFYYKKWNNLFFKHVVICLLQRNLKIKMNYAVKKKKKTY